MKATLPPPPHCFCMRHNYKQGHNTIKMCRQVIENGFPSVDSFFFIGATLLAYLTLKELDKKQGKHSKAKNVNWRI